MIFNTVLSAATGLLSGALLAATLTVIGGNLLHYQTKPQRSAARNMILFISFLNAVVTGMAAYRILPQ